MSDAFKERFERERAWRHKYGSTCREFLIDEGVCCPDCGGSGYKSYGSTATWHGGAGGQIMTTAVCDKCWGSGDATRPWPSHREYERMKREPK